METQDKESKLSIPTAIVVAGIIIALAVVYKGGNSKVDIKEVPNQGDIVAAQQKQQAVLAENLLPVTSKDHLLGNPSAPVVVVEFSDLECPFCQRFHPAMKQLMEEYGKSGKVAWVYRHFPLVIHPNALPEAIASECVAEQKGNIGFWNFIDQFFNVSLVNGNTDLSVARGIAEKIGVDLTLYDECMKTAKYAQLVQDNITDGSNAGVSGTPYSIVIAKNGKKFIINGALPYASVKSIVESALAEGI